MDDEKQKYGIPELKKFPMPDAKHVRSAIKFFNYVTPAHEKQLATAILKRMHEYGMSFDDFEVGEENRFSKYISKHLEHHGILGQKWGIRRYQNKDGSRTELGKRRAYKELVKANKNNGDLKGSRPKVGKEIDKEIDNIIDQNKNLIKESRKIEKELEKFEEDFYKDKKAVQKAILDKWDNDGGLLGDHLPNADKLIIETPLKKPFTDKFPTYIGDKKTYRMHTTDITPSLLKLWNNDHAAKDAYQWYIYNGDGKDKYQSLWNKKVKLDRRQGDICEKFSNELLGKYGGRPVKIIDYRMEDGHRFKFYDYANRIVTKHAIKRFNDLKRQGA